MTDGSMVGGWKRFVGFGRLRSNPRDGVNPKPSSPVLHSLPSSFSSSDFASSSSSSSSSSASTTVYYPFRQGNNNLHLRSSRFLCFRFLSISSSGENGDSLLPASDGGCRIHLPSVNDVEGRIERIVNIVKSNGEDMESDLNNLLRHPPKLSSAGVKHILNGLNDLKVSSLRFFNWVVDNQGHHLENFDSMPNFLTAITGRKDLASAYNYLLGTLLKNRRFAEGCDLLQKMEEEEEELGCRPNPVTFEILIVHACRISKLEFAVEIMNKMLLDGVTPRFTTHAVLVRSFFQSGRQVEAHRYVVLMSTRDRPSANMNYSLLARLFWKSRRSVEAGVILNEMMDKGLKPNFPDYVKIVKDLRRSEFSLELKHKFNKFPSPPMYR